MLNINGKKWNDIKTVDIQETLKDIEESYFFEFKSDGVDNKSIAKEISALANSYGGYIFLGIGNDKSIEGCDKWNEEKITSVIHDSITPTPSFDVKKFDLNGKTVYVIRIDEGSNPPYIRNDGNIFERLSSSSCKIVSSEKLNQLFLKKKTEIHEIEEKITLSSVDETIENMYGYFDLGFALTVRNRDSFIERFDSLDINKMIDEVVLKPDGIGVTKTNDSVILSFKISTYKGNGKEMGVPSNANDFIEIMNDGSIRLRCLFIRYGGTGFAVDMNTVENVLGIFKRIYSYIFSGLLSDNYIYARKYEKLFVFKQFYPFFFDEECYENAYEEDTYDEYSEKVQKAIYNKNEVVIANNRIPKVGLSTLGANDLEELGLELIDKNIIEKLFESDYTKMGSVLELDV